MLVSPMENQLKRPGDKCFEGCIVDADGARMCNNMTVYAENIQMAHYVAAKNIEYIASLAENSSRKKLNAATARTVANPNPNPNPTVSS